MFVGNSMDHMHILKRTDVEACLPVSGIINKHPIPADFQLDRHGDGCWQAWQGFAT
jgi:hypothetical protein